MTFDRDLRHRRSIRLKGYDYTQPGGYFATVCTENRKCLLGQVVGGHLLPTEPGQMVERVWSSLPSRFPNIGLDVFVVMPNHFHGIIVVLEGRGEPRVRPTQTRGDHKDRPYSRPEGTPAGSLGRIIQAFKSITTNQYADRVKQGLWPPFSGRLWQRNYYEHIIRNQRKLDKIREYICNNPAMWPYDPENPVRITPAADEIEALLADD